MIFVAPTDIMAQRMARVLRRRLRAIAPKLHQIWTTVVVLTCAVLIILVSYHLAHADAAPLGICRRITITGYPQHIVCGLTGCIGELRTGDSYNSTTVFVRGWRLKPWRLASRTILVCD